MSQNQKECEQQLESYRNEMATIFLENINVNYFGSWLLEAVYLLNKFEPRSNEEIEVKKEALSFITLFGDYFLPDLLNADNSEHRLGLLEINIIDVLDSGRSPEDYKRILALIGEIFLSEYKTLESGSELLLKFMKPLSALMAISETYVKYDRLYSRSIESGLKAA